MGQVKIMLLKITIQCNVLESGPDKQLDSYKKKYKE
jgi:hypothetical protein